MKHRAGVPSTRQDELTERRQFRFKSVDGLLERGSAFRRQFELSTVATLEFRIGQLGADAKQVLLDFRKHPRDLDVLNKGNRRPDKGIQLIDIAVGINSRIVFADMAAVKQAGIPAIAGFCVDLHFGSQYRWNSAKCVSVCRSSIRST